jgi:N utilization substance protein B
MGRRLARELALKVLYRYVEGDNNLPLVIENVLAAKNYQSPDKSFARILVEKTLANLKEIDDKIVRVIQNWEYDRISVVDKIILQIGTCELVYFDDIPPQISINEAIEIGKKYGGNDSGRFINGVLDAIRKNYEGSDNK